MMRRRWLPVVVAVIAACGSKKDKAPPAPPPQPAVPADAAAPHVDAALADAAKAMTPVDPDKLPVWDAPAVNGKGPRVELWTADIDGDWLLTGLTKGPLLVRPVGKKLTGRIAAPSEQAAFAAVAAQLGVADLKPPALKAGHGASLDLQFSAAPVEDLLRILGDVGRVNLIAPGPLGSVDIVVKRVPWDTVLESLVEVSGRTMTRSHNTFYVLPAGTALPELRTVKDNKLVDLDVKDATVGEAIAALRELVDVPVGGCTSPPFTLRVRRVTLAEALRAIEVASGVTLTEGTTCPTTKLATPKLDDLKLVAIAGIGTQRAAVFDRKGEVVTATKDGSIVKDIGTGYVDLGAATTQLHPPWQPPPNAMDMDPEAFIARMQRVAAVIHRGDGDDWSVVVETADGLSTIEAQHVYEWPMGMSRPRIDKDGLHVDLESGSKLKTVDVLLGH